MADDDETRAGAATTAADEPSDRDHDDRGDDSDEVSDGGDAGAGGEAAPRPRPVLDGRTIAICVLIALVAAVVAGWVTARLTADDEPEVGQGILTEAEDVPDISLPTLDGTGEVSPTDYAGQALVINFWASWCTPCVEEMPDFQRVYESVGDQVAFLGVNARDEEEAARRMAETTGVTYDLVRDIDGDLSRALEVTTLPVTVLVLPDGTVGQVFQRQVSAARLCEGINQVLLNQSLEQCG